MHEKRQFLSYRKRRHDAQITLPYAYYVTLGSRCKMANSSSEDETDTLPERPTRIQPYQFKPARRGFERVPKHRVSFEANPMRYYYYYYYYYLSLLCSAILRSRADSLRSHVILHEWIAFYSAFLNIHQSGILTALAWLVPQNLLSESQSRRVLCTPSNHAPCHFMQSHIRKAYACLAVTRHLRFWQNDRGLLRATTVTRGWNGYRNGVCDIALTEVLATQMGVMRRSKKVSSFELYEFNPLSPHYGSIARELVHCYTWGRLRIVTVRGNTVGRQS